MSGRAVPTDEQLVALARELPVPECPPERRQQTRLALTLVVERAAGARLPPTPGRRPSAGKLVAACAVAAAIVLGSGVWRGGRAPERDRQPPAAALGAITPGPGARVERLSAAPDERVRLWEGTIDVEVAHLAPGQRFRVLVGAEEVEVRGTAFTVAAAGDRLLSVAVQRGIVDVRRANGAVHHLGARERWQASDDLAPAAAAELEPAAPGPALAPARPPGTRPPARDRARAEAAAARAAAGESAFADGWAALRERDFDRAALAFASARAAAAGSQLAEDASFWRAAALDRGRHSDAAREALEDFLRGHPASDRAGEASVMLGWRLLDAGQPGAAAARFKAALDDRAAPVRAGAAAGMAAVQAAPAPPR